MNIFIKPSNKPDKKFMAIIDDKKTVHFGQKTASDLTSHRDEERKKRYIDRHKKNEQWNNPLTPGFWSRWITWEKPTLKEAVRNINQRFKNIHVKLQL